MDSDEESEVKEEPVVVKTMPPMHTVEWLYFWSDTEGRLPSPINISITGSYKFECPEIIWYNYDVYPHKIKVTNTGYTLLIGAKWKSERPYIVGGPLLGKHIFSQIHFHWGKNLMDGSEHSLDGQFHPAEMQVTYFYSEYITQQRALLHQDGVMVVCYIIKYGVEPDPRLQRIIDCFDKIREAQSFCRIGPFPLCQLLPMIGEDFFMYWGTLTAVTGETHIVRWVIPRAAFFATAEQLKEFRKLGDPWDDPNLGHHREIHEKGDRHLFFLRPRWCQYRSVLPQLRADQYLESISLLSPEYKKKPWMLQLDNTGLNEYLMPTTSEKPPEEASNETDDDDD